MNRTGKRVQIDPSRLFGTVILLGMMLAMAAYILGGMIQIDFSLADLRQQSPTEYTIIKVTEGDSVWSLAQNFTDPGTDLRRSVDKICEVNSLDNYMIYPGDELLIPVTF